MENEPRGGGPARKKRRRKHPDDEKWAQAGKKFFILGYGVFRAVFYGLVIFYVTGAIYYDGPGPAGSVVNIVLAVAWVILVVAVLWWGRGTWRRLLAFIFLVAVAMVPWTLICASNDKNWKPEFGETGRAIIDGDRLTFLNFRNFDYDKDGREIVRWEDKTVHFSNLRGLDYFHDAFGGDVLAHPILSFDFGPDGHVCLSIETRQEVHEDFSAVGGLFKLYELQYLFGSEEDFIRVRTNVRHEPVYLYKSRHSVEQARAILDESVTTLNDLADHARFYNVLWSNCTTSIRAQTPAERRGRFDWRMLINGRLDEYLYEKGVFVDGGLSFEELRSAARVNNAAAAAAVDQDPNFSARIREDRVGFP